MNDHPVFRKLREDHRRVLAEMSDLERAIGPVAEAGPLRPGMERRIHGIAAMLERQFATHMAGEAELLYPALAEAMPDARPSLEPLEAEHAELRAMLDALVGLLGKPPSPVRDEQIAVQVHDLVDLLRIHIRKEEALVFLVAERILDEAAIDRLTSRLRMPQIPRLDAESTRANAKGTRP